MELYIDKIKGKCLRSTKKFNVGDVVFKEYPIFPSQYNFKTKTGLRKPISDSLQIYNLQHSDISKIVSNEKLLEMWNENIKIKPKNNYIDETELDCEKCKSTREQQKNLNKSGKCFV
jgi:hypothetical protein